MNPELRAWVVVLLIVLGMLLALGLATDPRPAFSQDITPVVGEPVCEGPACLSDFSFLPTVLR